MTKNDSVNVINELNQFRVTLIDGSEIYCQGKDNQEVIELVKIALGIIYDTNNKQGKNPVTR